MGEPGWSSVHKGPAAGRFCERRQLAAGRHGQMDDLGPGEPAAQPAFRGDDCGFAHRVVDRLALVLLTVELDEEAQVRPRQVDEGDEGAARALNTELASGVW